MLRQVDADTFVAIAEAPTTKRALDARRRQAIELTLGDRSDLQAELAEGTVEFVAVPKDLFVRTRVGMKVRKEQVFEDLGADDGAAG